MAKANFKFHASLRVRWMEVDPQGIVYFGAYMDYLEVAWSEYFRNLGFSVYRIARSGYFDTAVVKTVAEYKAPARLDDMLELYTRVTRIGNTSITMEYEVYRLEEENLLTRIESIYAGYDNQTQCTRPVLEEMHRLFTQFEETGLPLPLEEFPTLAQAPAATLQGGQNG